MVVVSLRYAFRQPFGVPARAAYAWCTDFGAGDGALFPEKTRRSVRWLTHDTAIMTDTTLRAGRPLRIRRLVRLSPPLRAWTNTHLDGPFRHSQHWYRIVADGPERSHLEFEGLRLESSPRRPTAREVVRRAEARRRLDAAEWREWLAPALERDLGNLPGPARRVHRAER